MFGILSDYEDLATKYNNGEISFKEFSRLCKIRSNELNPDKKDKLTQINKQLISNG